MKNIVKFVILITLLFSVVTPVYAADPHLPPLPEWPIIGPVLTWLGIIKPEPETLLPEAVAPTPIPTATPTYPQYTIATLDDVYALENVEKQTTVRLIASEMDINTLITENITYIPGINHATLTLEEEIVAVDVRFDRAILQMLGIDLSVGDGNILNVTGRASLAVQDCRVTATLNQLKVNGIGIKMLVGKQLNNLIEENWPDEMCVESLTVNKGEIVVEGYRK